MPCPLDNQRQQSNDNEVGASGEIGDLIELEESGDDEEQRLVHDGDDGGESEEMRVEDGGHGGGAPAPTASRALSSLSLSLSRRSLRLTAHQVLAPEVSLEDRER